MAAAIRVEARCQPVSGEDLEQRLKRRSRAFLFDQKGRIELARRIIHRRDQVEHRLAGKPRRLRAVLVQHHPLARLALALAAMRPAPPCPFHRPAVYSWVFTQL
jgi:hypothetical protein